MQEDNEETLSEMIRSSSPSIFRNKRLLEPSWIVDDERIVGRKEQMKRFVSLFEPLMHGSVPPSVLAYGASGTGKSLISNRVAREYQSALEEKGKDLAIIQINCQWLSTNHQAVELIANNVSKLDKVDRDINVKGISTHRALAKSFEAINENYDSAIVIVDEIDLLVDPSNKSSEKAYSALLYQLTRLDDLADFPSCCVVALTNAPDFVKQLDGRAESSFNPRNIVFGNYDATQLREILYKRQDAFVDGTLPDEIIPYVAAKSAQDHGDARKAIDLLRTAGDVAIDEGCDKVKEQHVDIAIDEVARDRLLELAGQYSPNKKLVLLSASLTLELSDEDLDSIGNPVVENVYNYICDMIESEPRSGFTVLRYMSEFETHGLVESTLSSDGWGTGVHKKYKFNRDPGLISQTIMDTDDQLNEVSNVETRDLLKVKISHVMNEFYG